MVYPEQVLSRDTRDERGQCLHQSEARNGGDVTNGRAGISRVPWIISAMKFLLRPAPSTTLGKSHYFLPSKCNQALFGN